MAGAAEDYKVSGMSVAMKQAEEGMKLFKEEKAVEVDLASATAFKDEMDAKIAQLEAEAAALSGKENKKLRVEKEKAKTAIKNQNDYIDACKVVKGLLPAHGHFVKIQNAPEETQSAAPAATAEAEAKVGHDKKDKKEKPKKAQESAGLSHAERDELESLKTRIIEKKAALKEQGMSGGQINKDPEVVAWVARMNELKEKQSPGSTQAEKDEKKAGGKKKKLLDSDSQRLLEEKQKLLDEYMESLRGEFKYSKKEIAADPQYQEMKAEIEKLSK